MTGIRGPAGGRGIGPGGARPGGAGAPAAPGAVLAEIASGRVAPAYLVHGPDRLRHEEVHAALRRHVLAPDWAELNETAVDGDAVALAEVLEMVSIPPFGGGGRLVVVRGGGLLRQGGAGDAPGERRRGRSRAAGEAPAAGGDALGQLTAYLRQPPPAACLLFLCDWELPPDAPLRAAVEAHGRVVAARRPGPQELAAWLQAEAAALGRRLPPALAALLVERCQADRLLLRTELEKLVAYAGDRRVLTREDVLAVVGRSREERAFDLVDAVVAGRADRAAASARDLLGQGESPLGLIALLARQYRLVWQAKGLAGEGIGPREGASRLGVKPFAAEKAWRQARSLSEEDLAAALEAILEAELAVKTGARPPEVAVEALCVALTLRLRPGPGSPLASLSVPERLPERLAD